MTNPDNIKEISPSEIDNNESLKFKSFNIPIKYIFSLELTYSIQLKKR
jgi:hypothetical protein